MVVVSGSGSVLLAAVCLGRRGVSRQPKARQETVRQERRCATRSRSSGLRCGQDWRDPARQAWHEGIAPACFRPVWSGKAIARQGKAGAVSPDVTREATTGLKREARQARLIKTGLGCVKVGEAGAESRDRERPGMVRIGAARRGRLVKARRILAGLGAVADRHNLAWQAWTGTPGRGAARPELARLA